MKRVAVIGAGVMGLAAGYHALKAGHEVVVYEQTRFWEEWRHISTLAGFRSSAITISSARRTDRLSN
jgi:glycine/D-amino acid oxidase-like deaminating enzyme